MPLYEYKCQKCGNQVEAIRKLSDPPFSICPQCGGDLEKMISSPAIQFRGSGFYITDYARAGSGGSKEGSSSGESTGKTESAKSEKSSTPKTGESS